MNTILFMNGPSQDHCDRFYGMPTSLLYAISPTVQAIKNGEIEATYVDSVYDPVWYVEGINDIEVKIKYLNLIQNVTIIAASATCDSLYPTLQLLRIAKTTSDKIITILGGPYVDEVWNIPYQSIEITNESSPVDIAVAGDGEYILKQLILNISKSRNLLDDVVDVPGLFRVWIKGLDKFVVYNHKKLELDKIPYYPIELIDSSHHQYDYDIFRNENGEIIKAVQIIAQRGCVYDCNFCSESRRMVDVNSRSVRSLINEIEIRLVQDYRAIFFDDSTFGAYKYKDIFLDQISKYNLSFGCLNRFNLLTEYFEVEKYRKAGFVYFYCSIEQYDDDMFMMMNKNMSKKDISKSLHVLKALNITIGVSVLYGLMGEKRKTLESTREFIRYWVDEGVIILVSESIYSYHPGSIYSKKERYLYDRVPPNNEYPFNRFEEGQWYHLDFVDKEYVESLIKDSEKIYGDVLVRNRHSWYRMNNLVL